MPQVPSTEGTNADGQSGLLALFDVLGRRWALRIVWELHADAMTYRDLAGRVPGMSTSVLTQRLRELRIAGLVDHAHGAGYRLTPLGHQLWTHLEGLRDWAQQAGFAADLDA